MRDSPGSSLTVLAGVGSIVLATAVACAASGCGWDPSRPFNGNAPAVTRALEDLDAGDAPSAVARLEEYLSTGACKDGVMGTRGTS